MTKNLYFEDSTREELIGCWSFKFKDSAVFFTWDVANKTLFINDMDDESFDHLASGDFNVLSNLDIDVEALHKKLYGFTLCDHLETHELTLGETH